jgi:hypothetical protein
MSPIEVQMQFFWEMNSLQITADVCKQDMTTRRIPSKKWFARSKVEHNRVCYVDD